MAVKGVVRKGDRGVFVSVKGKFALLDRQSPFEVEPYQAWLFRSVREITDRLGRRIPVLQPVEKLYAVETVLPEGVVLTDGRVLSFKEAVKEKVLAPERWRIVDWGKPSVKMVFSEGEKGYLLTVGESVEVELPLYQAVKTGLVSFEKEFQNLPDGRIKAEFRFTSPLFEESQVVERKTLPRETTKALYHDLKLLKEEQKWVVRGNLKLREYLELRERYRRLLEEGGKEEELKQLKDELSKKRAEVEVEAEAYERVEELKSPRDLWEWERIILPPEVEAQREEDWDLLKSLIDEAEVPPETPQGFYLLSALYGTGVFVDFPLPQEWEKAWVNPDWEDYYITYCSEVSKAYDETFERLKSCDYGRDRG